MGKWEPLKEKVGWLTTQHISEDLTPEERLKALDEHKKQQSEGWAREDEIKQDSKALRAKAANTFLERLGTKCTNTLEETKEIGWYIWNRPNADHHRKYDGHKYYGDREKYENRFDEAVEEWKQGRRSRRFGVAFLGFVCGLHKTTVSKTLNDWAYDYRRMNDLLNERDKAIGYIEALSNHYRFNPHSEKAEHERMRDMYIDLIETEPDLLKAGEKARLMMDEIRGWPITPYKESVRRKARLQTILKNRQDEIKFSDDDKKPKYSESGYVFRGWMSGVTRTIIDDEGNKVYQRFTPPWKR